ncbi:hypothetical protein LVW35_07140 [Pseudomonas sp. HN11]|uniref:hypothetical protein n=1 Tax=Pseudomonas sp. HN11 TaxID=1344094 RepID=UPI001F35AE44|nr:hypothetical protein [Pseudomonas sp. HN11]UII72945.1 hypothetical protein LVW35_07140 [Pseudomonas sp. HN11]
MSKKRKGVPEIPRDDYVYGHTADLVSQLTMMVDPKGGLTVAEVDPSSIHRKLSHPKTKGDKIILSTPTNDFSLQETYTQELQTRFDYLAAVDTNTIADKQGPIRFDGYVVSAATVSVIAEPLQSLHEKSIFQPLVTYLILDPDFIASHEPLGWHLALTRHMDTPHLRSSRLGVVVDHDLRAHPAINARELPYYGDHLLPSHAALIYASADKRDTIGNLMIHYCDNIAGQILTQFKKHGIAAVLKQESFRVGSAVCVAIPHPEQKAPA